MKNRGVKDILIASIDGLNGFSDAIRAVFPNTDIQRCIVHQIRNSLSYVSYKDRKSFAKELKEVYSAINEQTALLELEKLEEKWADKYYISLKSWRNNWDELSAYFKYPDEIRKIIYPKNKSQSPI